ncbi:sensor histidine kinase [Humidisolicoccus flavus]|uniref:sensor histidine kinase n=1 Tax=Humidisolicoccus flavus TaxID=3111414 RepID=UPI0032556EE5
MKPTIAQNFATLAHLAVLGLIAPVLFVSLPVLFTTGVATAIVFGVGLLLLALVAVLIPAIAWAERARVRGLYGFEIAQLPMRTSDRRDWLRIPHTLVMQFANSRNWRALANFAIAGFFGIVVLEALRRFVGGGIGLSLGVLASGNSVSAPLGFDILMEPWVLAILGILAALAALVGIWFLGIAHFAISRMLLVQSERQRLQEEVRRVTQRREDAAGSAQLERTRLERDLHDGVQPRLVAVGMALGMAKQKIDADPAAASKLIDEAHASTKEAVTELRQIARGIHPAVLDDRGLDAALSALVARSHAPVELDVQWNRSGSREAEQALYFVVAEALTNIAKHSNARQCSVTIRERSGNRLWARIEDDGAGGARMVPGGGLDGIAKRVSSAGGEFSLTSPTGGPTTIEVSLPCAS